jgi:hypothetical protein
MFGSLSVTAIFTALGVMIYLAVQKIPRCLRVRAHSKARQAAAPSYRNWDEMWTIVSVLVWAVVLFQPYNTRMIPEKDGMIYTAGSCYGDFPIHMQLAYAFTHGCNREISFHSMMSPIFAGETLTYPYLPDFHAAIFVQLFGTLRTGFFVPGYLMALSLWGLLFSFGLRLTRSRWAGFLTTLLVIGAGGLG